MNKELLKPEEIKSIVADHFPNMHSMKSRSIFFKLAEEDGYTMEAVMNYVGIRDLFSAIFIKSRFYDLLRRNPDMFQRFKKVHREYRAQRTIRLLIKRVDNALQDMPQNAYILN